MLWKTVLPNVPIGLQGAPQSGQRPTGAASDHATDPDDSGPSWAARRGAGRPALGGDHDRWSRAEVALSWGWTTQVRSEARRQATDSVVLVAGQQGPDLARAHVEEGVILEQVHVGHQHLASEPRARPIAPLDYVLPHEFGQADRHA